MNKKIKNVLLVFLVCFFSILLLSVPEKEISVSEKMLNSTVIINDASGIVVYSDKNESLVLTAFHVIRDNIQDVDCSGEECIPEIYVKYILIDSIKINDDFYFPIISIEAYKVKDYDFNKNMDIAILRIEPGKKLEYATIAVNSPLLGDDIFTASNPNHTYRSLKKGIISAVDYRYSTGNKIWEISGGIIFGSSGGGAFNKNGELFGVIQSVRVLYDDYCAFGLLKNGSMGVRCIDIPITYMGYVSSHENTRKFLLDSFYSDRFNYLQ